MRRGAAHVRRLIRGGPLGLFGFRKLGLHLNFKVNAYNLLSSVFWGRIAVLVVFRYENNSNRCF